LENGDINKALFIVDGCGFGFYALSERSILDYTTKYEPTEWFDSSGWFPQKDHPRHQYYVIGEDLYFCRKLRILGYPTIANSRILLLHKGIGVNEWIQNQNNTDAKHCPVIVENF
jgi:hypothetical protein